MHIHQTLSELGPGLDNKIDKMQWCFQSLEKEMCKRCDCHSLWGEPTPDVGLVSMGVQTSAWHSVDLEVHMHTCLPARKLARDPEGDGGSYGRSLGMRMTKSSLFSTVLPLAASVMGAIDSQSGQWDGQ